MRPKEVSDRLQLEKIAKDHVWKVEPSCATTGEGIFEGLVRLTSTGCTITSIANSPTRHGSPTTSSYPQAANKLPIDTTVCAFPGFPAYTRLLILMPLLYRLIAF
jgi:hypothetical protein